MKKKIFIIAFILLCLAGTIWYHREIPMKKTMSFCSLEGDVIEVNFDITCHPSFFSPTHLTGTITIGDDVYSSSINGRTTYENFWEALKFKLKDGYATTNFTKQHSIATENRILVTNIIGDFEYVCILVDDNQVDSSTLYYGPAKNKETATAIMAEIVNEVTK